MLARGNVNFVEDSKVLKVMLIGNRRGWSRIVIVYVAVVQPDNNGMKFD